jgi:hypothetical protein
LSRTLIRGAVVLCTAGFCHLPAAQSPEPRAWNLLVRVSGSHDSNVPLAATETEFSGNKSTNVLGLGVNGDYRLYRDDRLIVAATGALQQTRNGDPALREFDLTSASPGLVARYALRLGGRPARLTTAYAARRDWLGGSGYATGQVLTADVGVRPARATEVGVFGSVAYTNFDDDGTEPATTSRDAVNYRGGVRGVMAFNRYRQALQASVSYVKNDADGANFVFTGPAANVQVTSLVWGPWGASVSAGYARMTYTSFASEPRRESTLKDYRLIVSGPLARKLAADLSYGRSYYDSNQQAFEAKRQNVSLGFTYAF